MTTRAMPLVMSALFVAAACAVNARPTVQPTKLAELWENPVDLRPRDLFYGPGGRGLAPDPAGRYEWVSTKMTGFSPGYRVRDQHGREWDVKLGPESRTEVAASRLVWAAGYHQPPIYYVPRWYLTENGKTTVQSGARFRPELPAEKRVGEWSWRNNPFLDTREITGLFVLMVMLNNWDLKTQQNSLYRIERAGDVHVDRYAVRDLGASFGKTNWWLPGTRDVPDDFEREPFIREVRHNRVSFHFKGSWREPQLTTGVTPEDVRWASGLWARLSPQQWKDAFRAGGYSEAEAARYISQLEQKIAEGLKLGPTRVAATGPSRQPSANGRAAAAEGSSR